jgi:outer membrane protein assembly factor BamE (lipoprotein component of BamABCDE complex)
MSSRSALAVTLLLATAALGVTACTPVTAVNGFIAVDVQPKDIKVGESRAMVSNKLGSPSTVSTFDKSTWYYITQTSDKMAYLNPQIKSRTITAIRFDKEDKVTEVREMGLKDGYDLAFEKRETPTRGKELSWIEQLLGNVGRGGVLPQDNDPGNPGGGGGRGSGGTGPH